MMKRMKLLPVIAVLGVLGGLLAGFQWPATGNQSETAVAQAAAPALQAAGGVVSAEGVIVPLVYTDLSFQTGGVVAEIVAAEGETVAAGDPLIRLENDEFEIALQQAQARLAAAEAGLTAAQNRLALAQAGVTTAEARLVVAQANLTLTQAGPLPEEIAAAEENLAVAEAAVLQAAGGRDAALEFATESQVQAAQAGLAAATAELRAVESQYQAIIDACFDTPQGEVCPLYGPVEEAARRQLEVAQARQRAAQSALDRLLAGPTAAQQRAAGGAVAVAVANRDVAQAQLDLLLAGAAPEEIAIAEVQVEQAQVGVAAAQVGVSQAEAAVTQAEAAVSAAQAGVAAAQTTLDRTILRAPFDGTVAAVNTSVGELVSSSAPVVTLADFSAWLVETTDLTELDVALVREGASAGVRIDAIPNQVVSGTVTEVALVSSLSRGDVVYEVTIQLDAAPALPLRWGMTVFADIDAP